MYTTTQETQLLLGEYAYVKKIMFKALLAGRYTMAHIFAEELAFIRQTLDGRFDVTTLKYN